MLLTAGKLLFGFALRGAGRLKPVCLPRGFAEFLTIALSLGGYGSLPANAMDIDWSGYVDILDYRFRDCDQEARYCSLFVDNGAWHAYALPAVETTIGFPGPYLLTRDFGFWLGTRFGDLVVVDAGQERPLREADAAIGTWAEPGRLVQRLDWPSVSLELTLVYAGPRTALLEIRLRNTGMTEARYALRLKVDHDAPTAIQRATPSDRRLTTDFSDSAASVVTEWYDADAEVVAVNSAHEIVWNDLTSLPAGGDVRILVTQSSFIDEADRRSASMPSASELLNAPDDSRARWTGYLERVWERVPIVRSDHQLARLAVKTMLTLTGNWRGAARDLPYDSLYPSFVVPYFNGVWSWDTWKQAVATSYFDPHLAADQIRCMFSYQNDAGMIADVIYYDRDGNNWRDSKPPLAGWAIWETYQALGDIEFLQELYPRLQAYHEWWYRDRDHDGDGLAEFGSTDGTKIAAAWESGMDNAVRFDSAAMLRNSASAWSMNQESVDLNAYLYAEKRLLARMAEALDRPREAARYREEAVRLRTSIQASMYDDATGFFYDTAIDGGSRVDVQGPEGWAPLWTGVATEQQASSVARTMLDPDKFATHMPFPTLAADHPQFNPTDGYWRGPVWLDQAYFATLALERSGEREAAQRFRNQLIFNAQGLLDQAPIYENYVPATGEGIEAPHFSWSAAHYLMLLADYQDDI